jgi:dolichol-phosphate mannosyltransferase
MPQTVDIITSAYNEEECLPELFERLDKICGQETLYQFRIIVIDNGSTDSSWRVITDYASSNLQTIAISMSRNFSLDAAFTCGLDHATGDLAIIMTSDLQDPPEQIPSLLRKYEEGFDQVLARITRRDSVPLLRRLLSKLFYRVASFMTEGMLPNSVSDFRLVNRKTYEAIRELRESHRFLRGLGAWVGFKTAVIDMERPVRFAGESKWLGISLTKAISQASKSIFAYSAVPLSWLANFGIFLSFFSLLAFLISAISWVVGGVPFAGFGTIVGLIALGFSLTMTSIGILAQYIGLIYEEVKHRPLYLVREKIN